MIVKAAYYPHQMPTKIVVQTIDGAYKSANLTPFRMLSDKDLTPLAVFNPQMGDDIPSYTLKFYGLSYCTDQRLKQLRISAGLTQQALADASGINIRQIQSIEAGKIQMANITLRNAKALADALQVPIDSLLD